MENNHQIKDEGTQRWEFIEKTSKQVDQLSDLKKVELHPYSFQGQVNSVKLKPSGIESKIDLK